MKKLFLFATAASALALSSFKTTTGSATITFNNNEVLTVAESHYYNCTNEMVDFTGRCNISTSGTINGNKISLKTHINYQELKGIGVTSGKQYNGNIVENDIFNKDFNGAYDENNIITGVITTAGSNNNTKVHINVRTQVNADGQVTTTISNILGGCQ